MRLKWNINWKCLVRNYSLNVYHIKWTERPRPYTLRYDCPGRLPCLHRRARHCIRPARLRYHHAQRPRGASPSEVSGVMRVTDVFSS